jgi:hypothetical protein
MGYKALHGVTWRYMHNVYKTVWLSEELLVYSYTIRAVWADDGDKPLLLLRNWGTIFFLSRDGRSVGQ